MKHKILLFVFVGLLVALNGKAQDFWERLPFPDSLDINTVAINFEDIIFVGTNTENKIDGIFRSVDSGQTWQLIYCSNYGPSSIAINPLGVIFVPILLSTGYYLLISNDTGTTWDSVSKPDYGSDVFIKSQGLDTLYLSQWGDTGAILLKSTDNGQSWAVIFSTTNHVSESVRDIEIAPDGDIYIGLVGYFAGQGGVYKSADLGATWQYVGLQDYQVKNIEINQAGDIFIGARDMGTYAIYHDNPNEINFLNSASNEGMVINSAGYIYVNSDWPSGTLCSYDNGESFSWVSTGSLNGPSGLLVKDQQDYLYSIYSSSLPYIYRTKEPTYTGGINHITIQADMALYPNPVTDKLTGKVARQGNCDGKYRLSILSMNSLVVMEEEISVVSGMFIIPVTSLPAGLYVLKLTGNMESFQARFVKI